MCEPISSIAVRFGRLLVLGLFALGLGGCATYATKIDEPRRLIEAGQYDLAIAQLKEFEDKQDNDRLLYLMDLGVAYHRSGRYQEAIDVFLKADKLAEIKDYTSLSQEAASVLLSDEVKPYKGEDFEKLLINVYLAIDFTLMHRWDEALVECRRVNHKLDLMISKGGLPYEQNAFAKYMAAMLFEARREWNDAFVDYRQVEKWIKTYPYLPPALLRAADKLKASQEYDDYRSRYPGTDYKIEKGQGEVVLILEQGRAPVKVESREFRLVPRFQKRGYGSDYVWLRTEDSKYRARSYSLFDIEATAIKELDNRIAGIVAKKIAGVVAKEAMAVGVEKATKSKELGFLTSVFLHAIDQADLRSWTTLPAKLQLVRLIVPAGKQNIVIDNVTAYGTQAQGIKRFENVEVKSGETVFLNWRTPD